MSRDRSILIYCQHLSGTGHFVRSYEIARALAETNEVMLLDGGRPVPGRMARQRLQFLTVPRLKRSGGLLRPVEPDTELAAVMHRRRVALHAAVKALKPSVLMVEHFPFSKWELHDEIMAVVGMCRSTRPTCRVICSLRDIVPPSRFDSEGSSHAERTLGVLRESFDGVLVHGDPKLMRLEDALPWAIELKVPVHYTGYVSQKPAMRNGDSTTDSGPIIVSSGGAGDGSLIECCLRAWPTLVKTGIAGGRELVVLAPPFADESSLSSWDAAALRVNARMKRFDDRFLTWMERADLVVCRAGYNTCTNLLEARKRALLVPLSNMSDQIHRARILTERGLFKSLADAACTPDALVEAIARALAEPPPIHDIDLNGAATTANIVREWISEDSPVATAAGDEVSSSAVRLKA